MFLVKVIFLRILLEVGVASTYLGENDVFRNLTLKESYQSMDKKHHQNLKNDFNMDSLIKQLARKSSNATSECTKHFLSMNTAQLISGKWGQFFFNYDLDAHEYYLHVLSRIALLKFGKIPMENLLVLPC